MSGAPAPEAGNAGATASALPRIVSLVPSLTELLCALGLGHCLVGRTRFCIHPADVLATVPRLGGTKQVNEEAILALRPTHLIVNKDENEAPAVERLAHHIDQVIVTHPMTAADNLALFEQFARAFGDVPGVRAKADGLSAQLNEALRANAALRATQPEENVLYLIWKAPWMTVATNTYIADMLATVGWRTVTGAPTGSDAPDAASLPEVGAARYPVVDEAWMLTGPCRRVLLSSEPYRFRQRHVLELQAGLDAQTPRPCTVHLVDGEMCSWYGPRAIAGLQYLRQLRLTLTTES